MIINHLIFCLYEEITQSTHNQYVPFYLIFSKLNSQNFADEHQVFSIFCNCRYRANSNSSQGDKIIHTDHAVVQEESNFWSFNLCSPVVHISQQEQRCEIYDFNSKRTAHTSMGIFGGFQQYEKLKSNNVRIFIRFLYFKNILTIIRAIV